MQHDLRYQVKQKLSVLLPVLPMRALVDRSNVVIGQIHYAGASIFNIIIDYSIMLSVIYV